MIFEQYSSPEWIKLNPSVVDEYKSNGCDVQTDSDGKPWCKAGTCNDCPIPPPPTGGTPPTTASTASTATTATTATTSGLTVPDLSDLGGLITNAWGKITSWFGEKVDGNGNWMKDKFTKSDIERAQEECYKIPFKDEDSAKKALESGDIVDYYQLKDKDGKVVFLGKAWDCDNKGGTPPCFNKLSGGKYDSEKEVYIEEYFEELDDAGVYEYYCNGSVAFKPYYESDATGGYVESGRPKVWYKWDPKTGVINKA